MFENMFTTKMSMDKEKLQHRFLKIRSKRSRVSRLMAVIVSIVLVLTIICSIVVMAAFDSYNIKIYYGSKPINPVNKPFFYENSVYVPLREMSVELGFPANDKNRILWDNGKITLYIDGDEDYYELNIGSNQIKVDAVNPAINAMGIYEDRNVPVLVNGTTYVPLGYIYFIFDIDPLASELYYTFGDIVSNEPYMDNAEYFEYDYIYQLQYEVGNGHYPWRLNAESTIQDYLSHLKGMENGRFGDIKSEDTSYSATYTVGGSSYYIELFKPAGKDGIWIVKDFYNTNPPYTKNDIKAAKEIVANYLDALNNRDTEAALAVLDSHYNTPNAELWHDENITLNSIELDLKDSIKNGYSKSLKDSEEPVSPENIIVLTADLTIDVYGESPYTGGEYNGYSYILVRDSKDSRWRIHGMGYFV